MLVEGWPPGTAPRAAVRAADAPERNRVRGPGLIAWSRTLDMQVALVVVNPNGALRHEMVDDQCFLALRWEAGSATHEQALPCGF
jgi:hypothetical protein